MNSFSIQGRQIGSDYSPLVIAEIGINHEGKIDKAIQMVDDALRADCECVKFQYHVIEDEMIPNDVIPGNADESIWEIMKRCSLTPLEEKTLKDYVESLGLIYLSTPFSRAASNELEALGVKWYKIGSGECNNYPLVKHIASFGKPIILSTGMNDISTIKPSVDILREANVPYALLHCTSIYPTPYNRVRLRSINELSEAFPDAVIGLSDHSIGPFTCFASIPLGASILEKHFTSNNDWPGPDVPISINPSELKNLVHGSKAIFESLNGTKTILEDEKPTIDFAYACVVSTRDLVAGEILNHDNIWVKRPGTGEILAKDYNNMIGRSVSKAIPANTQLSWSDLDK